MINNKQREYLANGLKDLANLLVAGLVINQAFSADKSRLLIAVGMFTYLLLYSLGIILVKGEENG